MTLCINGVVRDLGGWYRMVSLDRHEFPLGIRLRNDDAKVLPLEG